MSPEGAEQEAASFDIPPEEFRRLGYRFVDVACALLQAERDDPILRVADGQSTRDLVDDPVPRDGSSIDELSERCRTLLLQHGRRNGHPRFFGFVCASADPVGVLADLIASASNQNVTSWRSAPLATEIERVVLRWIDRMLRFDGSGNGLLVSGGSMANATAIACALARGAGGDSRLPMRDRLTIYASHESHISIIKAARLCGVPDGNVRRLEVDEHRRMNVEHLDNTIQEDFGRGLTPACVCATAGSAGSGAIDPLDEVLLVSRKHRVWLHIDGAYGAPAVLTPGYRWMAGAFKHADSLSVDPHKWFFAPFDVGCVLIRDAELSSRVFSSYSPYTAVDQQEHIESFAFFDHGLELSRRFRALKVWMILKARGLRRLSAMIEHNIALRRYLDERLAGEPELELLGSELSISCFRYRPAELKNASAINRLNRALLESLLQEGRVYLSSTRISGQYALRACILNFRTRRSDIDALLSEVTNTGRRVFAALNKD